MAELLVDPSLRGAWLPPEDVLDALVADAHQTAREGTLAHRLLPGLASEERARAAYEAFVEAFVKCEDGPDGPDALALMAGGAAVEKWLEEQNDPRESAIWGFLLNAAIVNLAFEGAIVTRSRALEEPALAREFDLALADEGRRASLVTLGCEPSANMLAEGLVALLGRKGWFEGTTLGFGLDALLHLVHEIQQFGLGFGMKVAEEGLSTAVEEAAAKALESALTRDVGPDLLGDLENEIKDACQRGHLSQEDSSAAMASLLCLPPAKNPFLRELYSRSFVAARDKGEGDMALVFSAIWNAPTAQEPLKIFEGALKSNGYPKNAERVARYRSWLRTRKDA